MSKEDMPPPYPGLSEGGMPPPPGSNTEYPPNVQAGFAPPPQSAFPPQPACPPQPAYPPQPTYPPQPAYPPQLGYPPQPTYQPPPMNGFPVVKTGNQQQGQLTTMSTVVVTQPAVNLMQKVDNTPVRITCPHCRADIVTSIHYESGTCSWVACVLLCIFGCNLGCCLIPFCVDSCQDVIHNCPNCGQQVARSNRM